MNPSKLDRLLFLSSVLFSLSPDPLVMRAYALGLQAHNAGRV